MTRRVWPFRPLSPILDAQEWMTDVFRAKASEQRIALRDRPLRTFTFTYQFTDYELNYAQALLRANQAADGFYVPDWTQADEVGAISSGSAVSVSADLDDRIYGDDALVWESLEKYERVTVTADSGGLTIDDLSEDYSRARIMPLWFGDSPDGGEGSRIGARRDSFSINFVLEAGEPFGGSDYEQYLGFDVVPDCPILEGGLPVAYGQEITQFGTGVGNQEYLRRRDLAEIAFSLRWKKFDPQGQGILRDWIATRYGRLRAFWASSSSQDLEPAADISGASILVYNDVLARNAGYHLEVKLKDGTSHYREVTGVASGSETNGRATVDLTIDSSITANLEEIERISYLYCCRFDSDRVEYTFDAPNRLTLVMPCREVPVP